jgi:hypothetical protein
MTRMDTPIMISTCVSVIRVNTEKKCMVSSKKNSNLKQCEWFSLKLLKKTSNPLPIAVPAAGEAPESRSGVPAPFGA